VWFISSQNGAVAELVRVVAHVAVVLLVALYKDNIGNALLGVDLVSEGDLVLFAALLNSISVFIFSWRIVMAVKTVLAILLVVVLLSTQL
jgi:hypothetical protein